MQHKSTKKISFIARSVKKEFSSEQLTSYSGLKETLAALPGTIKQVFFRVDQLTLINLPLSKK